MRDNVLNNYSHGSMITTTASMYMCMSLLCLRTNDFVIHLPLATFTPDHILLLVHLGRDVQQSKL